ncbi:PIN domain-containing protein [Capnocytophaga granulosa]
MIVIADSNIFYSALIAPNGEIATILKDRNMQFIAPDFIIEEVIKAGWRKDKTEKKILAELKQLLEKITIIPLDEITKKNLQDAFEIVKDVDKDDYAFVAVHLQFKHKIWSRDEALIKGLTEKGYGHFFISTDEVRRHLYKKRN